MDSIKFLRGFQQVRVDQYLQNKSWKHFKSIHIYLEKPEEILIQKTTISESGLSEQSTVWELQSLNVLPPITSAATTSYTDLLESALDFFFFYEGKWLCHLFSFLVI